MRWPAGWRAPEVMPMKIPRKSSTVDEELQERIGINHPTSGNQYCRNTRGRLTGRLPPGPAEGKVQIVSAREKNAGCRLFYDATARSRSDGRRLGAPCRDSHFEVPVEPGLRHVRLAREEAGCRILPTGNPMPVGCGSGCAKCSWAGSFAGKLFLWSCLLSRYNPPRVYAANFFGLMFRHFEAC